MWKLSSFPPLLRLGCVPRRVSHRLHVNPLRSCSHASESSGPLERYRKLVGQGRLQHDPNQERVASALDDLFRRLEQYEKHMEEYHVKLENWEKSRENERRRLLMEEAEQKNREGTLESMNKMSQRLLGRWGFGKRQLNVQPGVGRWVSYLNRERKLDSLVGSRPTAPPAPKGLYLYGNVGSGKTMLMDMFFSATEGVAKHRQRFHFHEAMLKINEQMHKVWVNHVEEKSLRSGIATWIINLPFDSKVKEWLAAEERYKQDVQMKHILPAVADKFLVDQQACQKGASILCFDEIQEHINNFLLAPTMSPSSYNAGDTPTFIVMLTSVHAQYKNETVDVFAIVALSGILSRLLSTGTVLVATSNRAPWDLNQDGMQKQIFDKLIAKLEQHCDIVPIGSEVDYRRLVAEKSSKQVYYFWPLDSKTLTEFENKWHQVVDQSGGEVKSCIVPVMFGRALEVPESCNGVARFLFEYLCGRPVGAADYIAVAKNYHTVFISDIPVMSMRIRDKARRFITLVDELYNHHCRLVCSAAASIDELFQGTEEGTLFDLESFQFEAETEGTKLRRDVLAEGNVSSGGTPTAIVSMLSGQEEMFAFRRAVSRLIEMQTPQYHEGVRFLHPYFQGQQSRTL